MLILVNGSAEAYRGIALGTFRLNLLGPFGLFAPDGRRVDIRSRTAVAMVAMLAMAPNGVRTRSWLQSRLWGSRAMAQAQSSLRRELANLAALLADHDGATLLSRGVQRIELDLDRIELDVLQLAVNGPRTDLRKSGEFLEGLDLPDCDEFEDWLREQRIHFADLARRLPSITSSQAPDPAALLGAALTSVASLTPDGHPSVPPKPSLVVLPFKVTSSTPADAWLGESMAGRKHGRAARPDPHPVSAATIAAAPGQDLAAYAASLIARFRNPALNHRLAQIAMDGSQKLPQRWLETLAIRQQAGQQCPAILHAIAAWIGHLRGHNGTVDDPLAADLLAAATSLQPVQALFGQRAVLASSWNPSASDAVMIMSGLD